MKVLNIGSLNYDYVYSVSHIVQGGETISSTRMETFCGGKGLNQSIALAKAGVPVYHAGLIGEEGERFLEVCHKNCVDTTYISQIPGKSGHTIIQVDDNAQNCIILYGGANQAFTKTYIDGVLSIEGEQITGEREPEKILCTLKQKYPEAKVVLTLGADGVMYQDKTTFCKQDIFKVKAVDTTAAGDTFTGYFIAAMLEQMPIEKALRLCAKASSIAVSRKGATDSIPMRKEVEEHCC